MRLIIQLFAVLIVIAFSDPVFARGRGGWTLGANFGIVNAEQKDMDSVIGTGATGASDIGNGLEINGSIGYSFGDVTMLFRPGYYWVNEEGTGSEYSMNAISLMPMLRWNLLSNNTITFYTQLGLGWHLMSGEIKDTNGSVEFSGSGIGYAGGLGSEFCFFGDHCFYLEANLRIAEIDRMSVSDASGALPGGISQGGKSQELELNNRDFAASLSGIQGVVGYNLHF